MWLAFGTGKAFVIWQPILHALTACNTVASSAGHGQKRPWSTWNSQLELADALLKLANGPKEIPNGGMNVIERLVIRLFN